MDFSERLERDKERTARMSDPKTADNMEVRLALIRKMHAGEMTLEQVQKELKKIQSKARREGNPTMYGSQRWVKPS